VAADVPADGGHPLFEAQVNDLYTRALMPGLAHLYIGEEAVAVGVCEALAKRRLHHQHASRPRALPGERALPDRMFAELLGKEAGYCKGKGGSMHIADPATGNLGANAIVGGSAGIATGAAFPPSVSATARVAVCFFGEGALGPGRALRSDESGAAVEAAGDLRLREQSLYRIHALFGNHGGDIAGARDGLWISKRRPWMGRMCAPSMTFAKARWSSGPARRGPRISALQYLSLSRPSRRRHQSRILPFQAGRATWKTNAIRYEAFRNWLIEQALPIRQRSIAMQTKSSPK
jgi:hypothetical protein